MITPGEIDQISWWDLVPREMPGDKKKRGGNGNQYILEQFVRYNLDDKRDSMNRNDKNY